MSDEKVYHQQLHLHGPRCGHATIEHDGHDDYVNDGRLDHTDGHLTSFHSIEVTRTNPERCTPAHDCKAHDAAHTHGPGCGHEVIPHGDHVDYLVDDHLHHPCKGHCDDHGPVIVRAPAG